MGFVHLYCLIYAMKKAKASHIQCQLIIFVCVILIYLVYIYCVHALVTEDQNNIGLYVTNYLL